jgi:hypothetical protein
MVTDVNRGISKGIPSFSIILAQDLYASLEFSSSLLGL